jgi:hypothetical protein
MSLAGDAPLTVYGAAWCPHCKRVLFKILV